MRSKDIVCIYGASLIIYGYSLGSFATVGVAEDMSSKLSVFIPAIGTTQSSIAMDFIRLVTASWAGTPAAGTGDGYVDFSGNNTTKMQHLKTSFTPPANQTNYHISYYTNTLVAPPGFPIQVDVGTSNGIGLTLGMTSNSGALGNLYNTTNAFCLVSNPSNGNPIVLPNAFIVSRVSTTQEHFYYAIDETSSFNPNESGNSPVTSNTTSFAPGFLVIGADLAAPGVTYTTKNCEGMSVGPGLTSNQAFLLLSAYYYIHTNKQ